jgi:DNA-binding response OmpR family regulator
METINGNRPDKILVIEDEPNVLELIKRILTLGSFDVDGCGDAESGLAKAREFRPDMVLLDVMLPEMDGLEFCRRIKSEPGFGDVQVIMVTGKGKESDIAKGLAAGADDYLIKPFGADSLVRCVRAVRRRGPFRERPDSVARIVRDGLVIDPERGHVQVDHEPAKLTETERRLLQTLASYPGRVFPREQLLSRVIRHNAAVIGRNIDVHIGAIRRKMGPYRSMIETVRGIGYRFQESGAEN